MTDRGMTDCGVSERREQTIRQTVVYTLSLLILTEEYVLPSFQAGGDRHPGNTSSNSTTKFALPGTKQR